MEKEKPPHSIINLLFPLFDFVKLCTQVLSEKPLFVLINSYTTGLGATVLENILKLAMKDYKGKCEAYELALPTDEDINLPCGTSGVFIGDK